MDIQRIETAIAFIEGVTKDLSHGNKSFYEHLIGTYRYLMKTGESHEVCMAGLYHSIYDTCYYQANLQVTRDQVKELIGESSENLAYLFCTMQDRTDRLVFSNDYDLETMIKLLKIEYANLYDQNFEPHNITDQMILVDRKLKWIKQF